MISWVRLWHDMPTDPKFRTIAKISRQPLSTVISVYLFLLVDASCNAVKRGVTQCNAENVASALDLEIENVEAIIHAMEGRVLDKNKLTGWEKRQPKREDNSSERVTRLRFSRKYENNVTQCNAVKRTVTQCNAPDKDTEKDKDNKKEKEQKEKRFLSGKPDVSVFLNNKKNHKAEAEEVLSFLNEKTGRSYRPVEANLKFIINRLQSGASVMDCRRVIAKKFREWKKDDRMIEYIRPATLFNAVKFEQYLGELIDPEEKKHVV